MVSYIIGNIIILLGITMIGAWGTVLPIGISIALMCKAVCPGRSYMFVSSHNNYFVVYCQ